MARLTAPDAAASAAHPTDRLIDYYSEAGPDYAAWSPEFNMHFGYFEWSMNPFRREAMLRRMNAEVLGRVRPLGPYGRPLRLLDLGCGVGATARAATRFFRNARVTGITKVPWQVRQARELTRASEAACFLEADYTATGLPAHSFDGAWAVESACHARGKDKPELIAEAFRVLKPGASFVVADGFLKHDTPMRQPLRSLYRKMCECWVMDEMAVLGQFTERLAAQGFVDIRVEDASLRIAPSVLHVPWVSASFLFDRLVLRREKMTPHRWNNVWAPLLLMVIGLARRRFGYYVVTARKPL